MAGDNKDKDAFAKELLRQFNRETKGMTPEEKEEYRRNMFVQKKTKAKTMTAAKGGIAKKKMARGGAAAKKKMMKGGYAKKK